MSYLGIGSLIPTLKTSRELGVTLNYPVASACEQDNTAVTPSIKEPAGGTFSAPSGLTIDPNTGVITPGSSTAGDYVISYNVSGVVGNFDFEIAANKASGFNYGNSSFQQSGYATPTFDSGVESEGTFTYSSSTGGTLSITQNQSSPDNGRIDLSNSDIDTYSISYTSPGPCSTTTTISLEIVAAYASTSSFYFDGVNDYFDTTTFAYGAGSVSASIWIKTSASAFYNLEFPIIIRSNSGSGTDIGRTYGASTNRVIAIGANLGSTKLNDGNWHHLVWTRDISTGDMKGYVDGNSTPEVTSTHTGTFGSMFRIGAYTNAAGAVSYHYEGLIDEVSIWNTALSTDAITEIYNSGSPNDLTSLTNASSSNLKAWYKM